jgi:RNA polymerase sigma-70 factor (ECF subfamily)
MTSLLPLCDWAPGGLLALFPALCLPLLGMARRPDSPEAIADREEEHALVRKVLEGDGEAYRVLVERYQERIYFLCFGFVRNKEDATDLAQEAFVKAYKNLPRFEFRSKFYSWLARIASNLCIDWLRRKKVRKSEEFDESVASKDSSGVLSMAHYKNDPGRSVRNAQLRVKLAEAIEALPEQQRQAIVLREIDGLAYRDIAEIMGIPEGTVMSRLYYARKKLQQALEEER